MAQGAFIGAGGVKDLKSCYVGAGGVKTVKQIYIGQGGSVKLVWPSAIYNEGSIGTIGGGFTMQTEEYWSPYTVFYYDTGSYIEAGARYDIYQYSTVSNNFQGGFTPSTVDLSPYSTLRVTYRLTKASTRSLYTSNNRVNSSLNILTSSYAFSQGFSGNNPVLYCNGIHINWTANDTDKPYNSYIDSKVAYHLMSNSDTASTSTDLTLSLDVSSISASKYIAVAVAMGVNMASADAFTIRIMKIELVV